MTGRRRAKAPLNPLVARGSHGRLKGPVEKEWPVRVSELDGEEITLVLLVGSEDLDSECAKALMLECKSERGVTRIRGTAVLEDADLVRFTVTDTPEVLQRRAFFRIRAPQRVRIGLPGASGIRSAFSLNISGGGMLLSETDALEVGDQIRFHLHLDPDSAPLKGRGRVVRSDSGGQRGIVFEQILAEDRDRLIRFIFALQREELAKTRGDGLSRTSP
jgi:hypothetical protein